MLMHTYLTSVVRETSESVNGCRFGKAKFLGFLKKVGVGHKINRSEQQQSKLRTLFEDCGEVRDHFKLGWQRKVVVFCCEDFCFVFGTLGMPPSGLNASFWWK